jgi:hypothetical protein
MGVYDKIVDGRVYMLSSDYCDKFYIGSTTVSLETRLQRHIDCYYVWIKSRFETCYLSSFEIIKYGDYRMELLEDCPCISGWDLLKREQYHQIMNYKDIVNIFIAGRGNAKRSDINNTNDVYTCICGANMTNRYKVRKTHCLSNIHRKKIREIHGHMIVNNPHFEFIKLEENPVEFIYEGITLNIN